MTTNKSTSVAISPEALEPLMDVASWRTPWAYRSRPSTTGACTAKPRCVPVRQASEIRDLRRALLDGPATRTVASSITPTYSPSKAPATGCTTPGSNLYLQSAPKTRRYKTHNKWTSVTVDSGSIFNRRRHLPEGAAFDEFNIYSAPTLGEERNTTTEQHRVERDGRRCPVPCSAAPPLRYRAYVLDKLSDLDNDSESPTSSRPST